MKRRKSFDWRDLIVEIIFSKSWLHAMAMTTIMSLGSVWVCLVTIVSQRALLTETYEKEVYWENKYKAMVVEKNYYAKRLEKRK